MIREKLLSEQSVALSAAWAEGGPGLPNGIFQTMTRMLTEEPRPQAFDVDIELRARLASYRNAPAVNQCNVRPSELFYKVQRLAYDNPQTQLLTAKGAPLPLHLVRAVNREHVTVDIQEKARNALGSDQQLSVQETLRAWTKFAEDVAGCADRAQREIEGVVGQMSTQRRELMSLTGRVIWMVLTVGAPPPFGVVIGALVRGLLSEDTWTGCIKTTGEWLLQTTFPQDAQGNIKLGAPVNGQQRARFAPSVNPGGHANTKDLKDMVQVLPGLEKCFAGSQKLWFDKLNEKTLQKLCDLEGPDKAAAGALQGELGRLCDRHSLAIRRAVTTLVKEFAGAKHHAQRLADVSWHVQKQAIEERLSRIDFQRESFIENTVFDGARLYLNTMVHYTIGGNLGRMGEMELPILDAKGAQNKLETRLLAGFLAQNIVPPSGAGAARQGDENFWAVGVGTVKPTIWQGPLAEKLEALGITKKRVDAPAGFFAIWQPPAPRGDWQAVPYASHDENARGRLAAWAVEYAGRSPAVFERELLGLVAPKIHVPRETRT